LGEALQALPSIHPIANAMRAGLDFRHPDALADALLHPIDRAYSVPQLYDWLERCGMAFGRWVEQAPYLVQCGMIAKTAHAERMAQLAAPLQHAAAELFRGAMVRHKLIAYRDDRVGARQPINFDGDRWREFVPIPVPWTVCVRERLPAGSAGVLINRAHPFTDLILPIDKNEDRVHSAIDGERTVAEVLAIAGKDFGERRAARFFERLWQYDHVVLYAPGQ